MTKVGLLDRIRSQNTGIARPHMVPQIKHRAPQALKPISIDLENLEGEITKSLEIQTRDDIEQVPRLTIMKFVVCELDADFIFRVAKGEAENYMGAMRQVLSRARRKARKKKYILDEFKMFHKETITSNDDYDEVVLIRTKTLSGIQESVYDELLMSIKRGDIVA